MKLIRIIITLIMVGILLFAGGLGLGFLFYRSNLNPVMSQSDQLVTFTINVGQGVESIGQNLHEQGLIRNPLVFKLYVALNGIAPQIQAGEFQLSPTMSVPTLSKVLTKALAKGVSVTLLEGWRIEEIAEALEKQLGESGIAFSQNLFLALPEVKEGYVFPDTYTLTLNTTEEVIAKTIEANFNQRLSSLNSLIESSPYSLDQIVTMASIVEREARTDREIVAGILWKRLENDWPLQADATLQYAKGKNALTNEWWTPPLAIDKEIDSPYNTYKNIGLPPAPICNPSLDSIEAVLNPTATEYWFYITDLQGQMHYGITLDDHNRNIQNYLR